jgi:hypothetical protein
MLQLFVSSLFISGIFGAFGGSFISKAYGRRPAMLLGGFCFLAGARAFTSAPHRLACVPKGSPAALTPRRAQGTHTH